MCINICLHLRSRIRLLMNWYTFFRIKAILSISEAVAKNVNCLLSYFLIVRNERLAIRAKFKYVLDLLFGPNNLEVSHKHCRMYFWNMFCRTKDRFDSLFAPHKEILSALISLKFSFISRYTAFLNWACDIKFLLV